MFIGESSCLLVFKLIILYKTCKRKPIDIGDQKFSPLVMLAPAMCDMCATSLMYMGESSIKKVFKERALRVYSEINRIVQVFLPTPL